MWTMEYIVGKSEADLLIVAGSLLKASSAHRLLKDYKGKMVILNGDPTPFDDAASLVINGKLGEIFRRLWPLA